MSQRYDELDSLRGLAAVSVMIHHLILVFVAVGFFNLFDQTPVHIFWAGHAAVIFFFVLSGFVLSLPYYQASNVSYPAFVAKRLVRIYVPYAVAIAIAIGMQAAISREGIAGLGGWFNMIWVNPLNTHLLLNHILLIGDFKNYAYDPVIWSLIHELRISLVFPFLMIAVRRWHWTLSLALGLALSLFAFEYKLHVLYTSGTYRDYGSAYTDSLHYMLMFIVGALLAKHRAYLTIRFAHLKRRTKWSWLVTGVLAYTYLYWFPHRVHFMHTWIYEDWFSTFGAAIFIVMAFASKRASRILLQRHIHFVGKMSYTLYLYHAICIMTLFNLLYGQLPTWAISALVISTSFVVSAAAYYVVERPAIRFAYNIGKRIDRHSSGRDKGSGRPRSGEDVPFMV